ncbi:MAG: anthranilate synthase component I family protein [Flavobacterium sp.]
MRKTVTHTLRDPALFKLQLLKWAQQFREIAFLDSNNSIQKYSSYDCIVAVDAFTSIQTDYSKAFEELKEYQEKISDYIFGHLSYDLKNGTEEISSSNFDGLGFSDLHFFQPKKIFKIQGSELEMSYLFLCDDELQNDYDEILLEKNEQLFHVQTPEINIQARISEDNYLAKASKILEHIQRGDIYEMNLCMEFFAENAEIDPFQIYQKLNKISQPPFAAFYKIADKYCLCASPERYIRRENNKIISQPIKGTAKRGLDIIEDNAIKILLSQNEKERSENIMIVDLVRNDLSKTAVKNSVEVEELCESYTFKQVHHLISTVVSEVKSTTSGAEIIRTTFPMGSMTGAPKLSAMQIIEKFEETKRGLYSGSIGYFEPNGNFDFNVVIRSILYNRTQKYVSFSVGSAITAASESALEYEECLLKAKAMRQVLQQK